MPAPSFRPLLAAIATAALLGGLVVMNNPQPPNDQRPPTVVIVAVIILAWSLIGWLRDARHEYVEAERADRTGHLQPLDAPAWPKRTFAAWLILLVVASLYQFGVLPPRPAETAAGGPGASPGASGEPSSGPTLPPGTLEITAKTITYSVNELTVDAGKPFAIQFVNDDPAGTSHDVDIRDVAGGKILQDQQTIDGGTARLYQYTALQPGTYTFECSIHPIPSMTGTLTVH